MLTDQFFCPFAFKPLNDFYPLRELEPEQRRKAFTSRHDDFASSEKLGKRLAIFGVREAQFVGLVLVGLVLRPRLLHRLRLVRLCAYHEAATSVGFLQLLPSIRML